MWPVEFAQVDIGAAFQQQIDDFRAVEHGCRHQRGPAAVNAAIHIGAAIEQDVDDFDVSLEGGGGERRLAAIICQFGIGAVLQKQLHDIRGGRYRRQS